MWILIPIALIILAMVIVALRRGWQMKKLVSDGTPVRATVTKKWMHGQHKYRLRYEYQIATDSSPQSKHTHSPLVSRDEYDRYNTGDGIDIVVLANNPKISATAMLVAQARKALSKKSQPS